MTRYCRFAIYGAAALLASVFPTHAVPASSTSGSVASAAPATARIVPVATPVELQAAIANAQAGDEIVIAPGVYDMAANLTAAAVGSATAPIVVRAASRRSVLIRFGASAADVEGFRVLAPWWRFEALDIEGACANDDNCEHAIHLSGDADHVVIRDNHLRDFNAQIKSNGTIQGGTRVFPDDVLVERNWIYDSRARQTANPVTKIDVVGGRRWIVRANTIFDFHKQGGDNISYAAFLKGNSRDGRFERNLVRCSWHTTGGTRIGLSLGGGGTGQEFCEDGSCATEHQDGLLLNNVIMNCEDVGIYLNKASNTRIQHNTLYATEGIDVRFATSAADLRNNLLGGRIRNRDGGNHTSAGDLSDISPALFAQWFVDPANADFRLLDGATIVNQGVPAPLVVDDFCGAPRSDGSPDIGALEYAPAPTCELDVGGGTPLDRIFVGNFD